MVRVHGTRLHALDRRTGEEMTGRLLHQTEPHGEHLVSLVDEGDGKGHYEIVAVEDSQGNVIGFTDEELDSLARWWLARRPRLRLSLP